jgi:hypothetical protein
MIDLPYKNAGPIKDPEVLDFLKQCLSEGFNSLYDNQIHDNFLSNYVTWIKSTKNNQIIGIDSFTKLCFSNGTSESFDKFYIKNKNRRFRCFKAEYIYHRLAWRNCWPDWQYIEDSSLSENDAVVISLPFSDTGNEHRDMKIVLDQCDRLGIPVLIDCAYFGACSNVIFDFDHPCITDIVFSLSKTFPVAHLRIGMRMTRTDDDDTLFVHNKIGYVSRLSSFIGNQLVTRFDSDYIYNKYQIKQIDLCNNLSITPSKCVLFGIGDNSWIQYNRGGITNRLCLNSYLI